MIHSYSKWKGEVKAAGRKVDLRTNHSPSLLSKKQVGTELVTVLSELRLLDIKARKTPEFSGRWLSSNGIYMLKTLTLYI